MTTLKSKFRPEDGNRMLKEKITPALAAALEELAERKLHLKVVSSTITHETLIPQGDKFLFHLVVTIYPKDNAPD